VFERFTERARQVVVLAQDEARALGHGHIGSEHLLLGLLREEEGLAFAALSGLGVTLDAAREQVIEIVGRGESASSSGQIPFTPRGKQSLELALRESRALGHDYIGTDVRAVARAAGLHVGRPSPEDSARGAARRGLAPVRARARRRDPRRLGDLGHLSDH
jgi:ATP-dependent Clp protease ATP-binding subunit ClpA